MTFGEYIQKFNIVLNEQQKVAVQECDGPVLLLAVPGSGKTTVIVAKIGYMIYCKNIKPKNIFTLTYSVASARDMKDRFEKKFGERLSSKVEFRTINSFCVQVIKTYEKMLNTKAFDLIENTSNVISKIYLRNTKEFGNEGIIKEISRQITYCKNMMLEDEEIKKIKIEKGNLYKIYCEYEKYKIENKLMDFDDQLKYAYNILKKYPIILNRFKAKYPYINIDEAQDTSKIQHEVIKQIVHNNIFMVGDEDQSIYGFRAAYPSALLNFSKTYKNAKVLLMETNYRSTKEIVKTANEFIKENKDRIEKNMKAVKENGKPIKYKCFNEAKQRDNYILENLKKEDKEIAILYRNNDSAIPIVDMLERNNIEFKMKEADSVFFSNSVILDIKNIIEFSKDKNNMELFEKIYYKINCGISKEMLKKLKIIKEKEGDIHIFNTICGLPQVKMWQIKKILKVENELDKIKKQKPKETIKSIMYEINYLEVLKSRTLNDNKQTYRQKINILYQIANNTNNINDFIERLEKLENLIKEGNVGKKSKINLSTIHGSKGLEYEKVFIIDVFSGILPSVNNTKEDKKEYEEEVRLFYVAMTRAKKELEILNYKQDYEGFIEDSVFIKKIFNKNSKNRVKIDEYEVGKKINHRKFGECIILEIDGYVAKIRTKNNRVRKIDLEFCKIRGII